MTRVYKFLQIAVVCITALIIFLSVVPEHDKPPWIVGERGIINLDLHACDSYDDWVQIKDLRLRQYDAEVAIKFLFQKCPSVVSGEVVVDHIAQLKGLEPIVLCVRPLDDLSPCRWVDESFVHHKQ